MSNIATPYDMMINDIMSKIKAQAPPTAQVDEAKVTEICENIALKVVKEVLDAGTRFITIKQSNGDIRKVDGLTHKMLPEAIEVISSGLPLALVGPTGGGKTLATRQIAKAIDAKNYAVRQVNRGTAPHDIIGYCTASGTYVKGCATDVIKEGGLLVIDELDNGNENILMILKGMLSGCLFMPYGMQDVHPDFRLCATMNTWGTGATREYVGRGPQDVALLNEFPMLEWDYDTRFEMAIIDALYESYTKRDKSTRFNADKVRNITLNYIGMRATAATQGIRCIISTRNLIQTITLCLSTQWEITDIVKRTTFKGLKQEDVQRLLPNSFTSESSDAQSVEVIGGRPVSPKHGQQVNRPHSTKFPDSPF